MTDAFGSTYSGAYDALYGSKDYGAEVDLIERILDRGGKSGPRRLLDLGCGTGNHSLVLARRGHAVVGVDRSLAMLALAKAKANAFSAGQLSPIFQEADIREVEIGSTFDAVIMMFAVLCYMKEERDVLSALAAARRHLDIGGLFIFDVWNGLAVLADEPKAKSLVVTQGSTRLVRETAPSLDRAHRICRVHFELQTTDGDGTRAHVAEDHTIRYFFSDELQVLLDRSGFDLVSLHKFPDGEAPPDESAWNIVGIARAR